MTSLSMADLPDLDRSSATEQWARFCDLLWHHDPLGLWLDVSRMALTSAEMQNLQAPRWCRGHSGKVSSLSSTQEA